MISEEVVELNALFEVFDCFHASDLLEEVEVAVYVDTGTNESMPVDALNLDVGVVFLELEVDSLVEVDVWSLNRVHVFSRHFKLIEIKILGEHLHLQYLLLYLLI
jgi:hypothetical protein